MNISMELEGMDELIEMMEAYHNKGDRVFDDIVEIGSKEIKKLWVSAAHKHGYEATGEMITSIGYKKSKTDHSAAIYPQGTSVETITGSGKRIVRKSKVTNAMKAFLLHYGTSKMGASYWIDTAMREANQTVPKLALKRWSEFIESRS